MRDELILAAKKFIYQLDEFPQSEVIEQISEELDQVIALNKEEVLKKRNEYIGIGETEDYLNHFIKTSEGIVLAGIRHMGGNREEPFVYLWPAFKINDITCIIKEIEPYFKVFNPKAYHFWTRPDCNDYNDVKVIQQRYIGRIDSMHKYDYPLYRPKDYYEWYCEQYKLFHRESPELINRVTVNTREMMEECDKQGLLYHLSVNEDIVGLIAGEREKFLGEPTVYIDEILISKKYRGKGYATKLLGSFTNIVDVKYLVCHIDIENIASTKTALRSGEVVFSQECRIEVRE